MFSLWKNADIELARVIEPNRVDERDPSQCPVILLPGSNPNPKAGMIGQSIEYAVRITQPGTTTDVKEDQLRGRLNDLGRRAHARDTSGHASNDGLQCSRSDLAAEFGYTRFIRMVSDERVLSRLESAVVPGILPLHCRGKAATHLSPESTRNSPTD